MKAAVIGLGVEGVKATKSLLNHGWEVYASDLQLNVDLSSLKIPIVDIDITTKETDQVSIVSKNLLIDLGINNLDIINSCDAIVLSPSLWNSNFASQFKKSGKLLQDTLKVNKKIFTIGITGTNGKTTSVMMTKSILEAAGKKVLVGGNGGGGFEGYYDLILEAENGDYDIVLVEVCDMTLSFCDYCFDFDLIGLTNIGYDHMDVHGTIDNYKNELINFFKGKKVVISEDEKFLDELKNSPRESYSFSLSNHNLSVFGQFNKANADLAEKITSLVGIDKKIIKDSLESFKPVKGRIQVYKLFDSHIYVGKTDNADAAKSILDEVNFYATFIGTPRKGEINRLDILNEVCLHNPEVIVLFPGLDDTIDEGVLRLQSIGYEGKVEVARSIDEIVEFLAEYSHEDYLFIGGNGQDKIIEIQERLEQLCKSCS